MMVLKDRSFTVIDKLIVTKLEEIEAATALARQLREVVVPEDARVYDVMCKAGTARSCETYR